MRWVSDTDARRSDHGGEEVEQPHNCRAESVTTAQAAEVCIRKDAQQMVPGTWSIQTNNYNLLQDSL